MKAPLDINHIKLNGATPYQTALQEYLYSREALVTALIIGGTSALNSQGSGDPIALQLSTYASMIAGTALGRVAFNWNLKKRLKDYFGNAHDNLFINKKPDANTLPTKPEHIAGAREVRNFYLPSCISVSGIIAAAPYLLSQDLPTELSDSITPITDFTAPSTIALNTALVTLLSTCATYVAKHFTATYRFNQVVRKKWVITDEPPMKTNVEPVGKTIDRWIGEAPGDQTAREAAPQGYRPEPVLI